jgi:NAD(P)-dependent dehydrogenase (short-subunit alcohol dehydrogenase family)
MDLSGKVALVTGAGSGLGKASAIALAEAGADLVLASRSQDELDEVADLIRRGGRRAVAIATDLADADAVKALFEGIDREFEHLDIVFANAGINGVWAPIDDLQPEEWDKTIAVNLRGTYLTIHHAVPRLKRQGGSITITSSINGTRTFTTAGASAYSTTKAGQVALAQMLAVELAGHKIRVNAVCPGAIESEIDENTTERNTESLLLPVEYPKGTIPLTGDKPGKAEDVADLVVFLSSNEARHITGSVIHIDGAQSLFI